MGSSTVQGPLWGAMARDWAAFAEPAQAPFYEAVFAEIGVGAGTRLLDVGCGAGLAMQLAAKRGATVGGIDAAEGLIAVARERSPEADIKLGDLEDLHSRTASSPRRRRSTPCSVRTTHVARCASWRG